MEAFWRDRLDAELGVRRIVPPAPCEVALVYPGPYAVGMSSLGYQMIYRWINDHPAALAERFFCEFEPALSVENQRAIDSFDVVAFSLSYELDYLETVRFLLQEGIALRAAERDPDRDPLVLAGGVGLLVNRLPMYDAADVLVLGDGEIVVARILDAWQVAGDNRRRFLEAIRALPGVEVTEGACRRFGLDDPADGPGVASPHFLPALESDAACSAIVTPHAEFAGRFLVELARGCPYRCRFCFYGSCSPYRTRPFESIRAMIERGRSLTNRFGLIAGAVGLHPEIDRLAQWCLDEGLDVAFSSLRVEDVTPSVLDLLVAGGQQSVTIAPEAGSERLRRHLGKRLTGERIVEFVADAVGRGLTDVRMYFMIGLPTEEPGDVDAITDLVESVRDAAVRARPEGAGAVTVSVNASVFVPKPGTPLAGAETPAPREVRSRLERLRSVLGPLEGVAFRMPSLDEALIQRNLAWGGRETLDLLERAARAGRGWRRVFRQAIRAQ